MSSISLISGTLFSINPSIGDIYIGPSNSFKDSMPLSALTIPSKQLPSNPYLLSLLSWRARLSDFSGRENELKLLSDWTRSNQSISMKFICDEGGVGKTRLAAHFAEQLKIYGWVSGFINLEKPQRFRLGKRGTLLIIDYPEEHTQELPSFLRYLASYGNDKYRIRVLFLTRQPITSWQKMVTDNHALNLLDRTPLKLKPLSGASAHIIYVTALSEASTILNTPAPEGVSEDVFTQWLEKYSHHNRPLFILAAAVHNALNPRDIFLRYSSSEVVQSLAEREQSRLRRIAQTNGFTNTNALVILLTLATVSNGLATSTVVSPFSATALKPPSSNSRRTIWFCC